ncbi:hypothetical protein JCM11251_000322 [Rhodosporidiobolus azoricus]
MDPLASTRVSLAWPPHPATEDCDVLVISGRSGFFLDVRVKRAAGGGAEVEQGDSEATEPVVDWATAGWKKLLPLVEGEKHPKASFTAVIDSRSPRFSSTSSSSSLPAQPENSPPDEGSFETLSNGDVLERGEMLNPKTNKVQPYEEVWRRLPLVPEEDEETVWVLVMEVEDEHGRAFVGQVGDYQLALNDGPGGFGIAWREKRDGQWEVVHQNKAGKDLPSIAHVPQCVEEGHYVTLEGRRWRVVEAS